MPDAGTRVHRLRESLLAAVAQYAEECPDERETAARFTEFLTATPDPFSRRTAGGHITSSAFVLNAAGDRILLVKHAKLGIWVQPGGHVDPDDASLLEAAKREVVEETAIAEFGFPIGERILDLDVHPIPARGAEPPHLHYDVRHLFTAAVAAPGGSERAEWVACDALESLGVDISVIRPARRAGVLLSK